MAVSVGDAVLKIGVDTRDVDKGLKGLTNKIRKHQKAIGLAMAAVGGILVGGLALSVRAAADFESAMREVNTMMQLTQDEFTIFSKSVQEMAAAMGVDAVQSAKALYQAISAGVPKENVLEFLEVATKAAIGGVTETEVAVDGLTTVINAFKLPMSDAQKVADIMFTTVKGGKTTFEELSASLFQVAPIAAASNVKFEEVAAALATMTKQGVPTTVATTQLRQAMVALQKPTDDMNKVIKELGFQSGQAMLQELGLAETLNKLKAATSGSNEMLMKMFGSVEAGQAVMALTGKNAKTFANDLDAMANSAGAATDAFEEMEKSSARQMAKLKASFKDISITVGTILLPVLTSVVDILQPMIKNIRDWAAAHPGLTKAIVIGTLALGSLLLVLGGILLVLPSLTVGFGIATSAIAVMTGVTIGLNAATLVLVGSLSLLVLGLGMMAWGILQVVQNKRAQAEATRKEIQLTEAYERALMGEVKAYALLLQARINELRMRVASGQASEAEINWLAQHGTAAEQWIALVTTGTKQQTTAVDDLGDAYDIMGQKRRNALGPISGGGGSGGVPATEEERRQREIFMTPDWIAGKRPPSITPMQLGGLITRPTLALLGEKGPELVTPLGQGMGGITVNIDRIDARDDDDIDRVVRRVDEAIGKALSQRDRIRG